MHETNASFTLNLLFTIAVVISVVVQSIFFIILSVVGIKAARKIMKIVDDISGRATPIVSDVKDLVQDIKPKVKTVSSHVVEISTAVRDQTQHVNSTVEDVVDKTRAQAGRVDEMVSAVLGSLTHAGAAVQSGVTNPVRKVGRVLRGVRVGLETLVASEKEPRHTSTHSAPASGFPAKPPVVEPIAGQPIEIIEKEQPIATDRPE